MFLCLIKWKDDDFIRQMKAKSLTPVGSAILFHLTYRVDKVLATELQIQNKNFVEYVLNYNKILIKWN